MRSGGRAADRGAADWRAGVSGTLEEFSEPQGGVADPLDVLLLLQQQLALLPSRLVGFLETPDLCLVPHTHRFRGALSDSVVRRRGL